MVIFGFYKKRLNWKYNRLIRDIHEKINNYNVISDVVIWLLHKGFQLIYFYKTFNRITSVHRKLIKNRRKVKNLKY